MPARPSTILGGLPVIADVSFGRDDFTGEYWADVDQIYWMKRDGSRGKPIPQHIYDRAEKADPYFASVIENVSEQLAYEAYEARD